MDEKQIKELLAPLFNDLKSALTEYVDTSLNAAVTPLQDALTQLQQPSEEPGQQPSTTDEGQGNSLEAKLEALQNQLKERDQKERDLSLQNFLGDVAASKSLVAPTLFKDAIKSRYGQSLVYTDGEWFVKTKDGHKALSTELDSFLGSDEAKVFLPPSGTNGASTKEGDKTASTTATANDPWTALQQAYSA